MARSSDRRAATSLFVLGLALAGCGGDESHPSAVDATPPATVTTLTATAAGPDSVRLAWLAPGDDGQSGTASRYDIRLSTSRITEENWDGAVPIDEAPSPLPGGSLERITIDSLTAGSTYYFALESADEVPNWSGLSNVAQVTTPGVDRTPPGVVTDLAAVSATDVTLTLEWTAPGDDGATGRAAEYDLRYARAEITTESWDAATRVTGMPAPRPAGARESFTVSGLQPRIEYWFALVTRDEVPEQWSPLSNSPSATTAEPLAPLELVEVPAGPFTMGSDPEEGFDDERPEHRPEISAFRIGRYEVTNAQYATALNWALDRGRIARIAGTRYGSVLDLGSGETLLAMDDSSGTHNQCRITYLEEVFGVEPGWMNHPVVGVSWYGAAAFCNWISEREGLTPCFDPQGWTCDFIASGYRLPSEAEWEKAARGSSDERTFPWGEGIDCDRCNYGFCTPTTVPVDDPAYLIGASPSGALHMIGNVSEWCFDWYGRTYYSSGSAQGLNPHGPDSGTVRIKRGGCNCGYTWLITRIAYRDAGLPGEANPFTGFRVVRRDPSPE